MSVNFSGSRGHLILVPPGRRTPTATRSPEPIRPPVRDWSVDLSCRSGCLVVAPAAAPPDLFWARVLLPLLRAFAGPVVLDTSGGNIDAASVADLAFGSCWLEDCPPGHLRVVVAPADLSWTRRQLGPAGIGVFRSVPDATDDSR